MSPQSPGAVEVVHAPERSRFEVVHADDVAVLVYELEPDGAAALLHTVVPVAWEGHGVGSRLVTAAMDWARREQRAVIPVCVFVQAWLVEHPEQQDLVRTGRGA